MYKLYDFLPSGNGYKARMVLTKLQIPFEYIEVDIITGGTRTDEFLRKNPNGKIPTLEHAPGQFIFESNAIMYFLADGTALMPDSRVHKAQVMQWLFFEQYSHEPYIAVSRFVRMHNPMNDETRAKLADKRPGGDAALKVMEQHLAERDYFVGDACSIADLGLYAYTHVAEEGGFDLSVYPAITRWLARIAGQPHHPRITDTF